MRKVEEGTQWNEDEGKFFVRRFLIDDSENGNHWAVNKESISHNIGSFIGKPFVVTETLDHPKINPQDTLEHNLQYQQQFAIGNIVDVVKSGTRYDAIIEITNKDAADLIRTGKLPVYVSPQIVHNPDDDEKDIKNWMGIHLAIVSQPAYGVVKTSVARQCEGNEQTCLLQLKKASSEACKCIKTTLSNLINKSSSSQSITSQFAENNISNSDLDSSTPGSNVPKVKSMKKQKKAELKQVRKAFSTIIETEKSGMLSQIETLKTENASLTAKLSEMVTKFATLEKEQRKKDISAVVSAEIYTDAAVREAVINSFVNSTASLDEIKAIVSPIKAAPAPKPKQASVANKIPLETSETVTLTVPRGVVF